MRSVLILCEYATLNGGERSMLSALGEVIRAGYDVRVAAPASGPLADVLRHEGVEIVPLEPHDAQGVRLSLDERRSSLARILKWHRPTLLHANSLAMGRLSGPVAAEVSLPSVAHLRDIVTLSRQAVADLNCHSCLLAVSAATRQFHVDRGLDGKKTFVLYNGVDLDQFRPRAPTGYLHEQLGLARDVPLIGTIGQISLRKGQDVLAAALSKISSPSRTAAEGAQRHGQTPESRGARSFAWLIIGERFSVKAESRQFEDQLHQAAAGPLAGRVHFFSACDDVASVLNELTLLVHPARQEPLGRVLLEAAAAGVAVVATDVGGMREIFPPECAAACLVPPDDVPAMSAAVANLLDDPDRRRRFAGNARRRAEQLFDRQRATAGLLEHYARLTG
jgi:glycosyltransferase involved in cell wall biosynthesis